MSSSGSLRFASPMVGLCMLLSVASAGAQPPGSAVRPLPRVFVGTGAGPSTNDASSRMRLYEEGLASVWLIEAGAAVSERVGIGVEYSMPSMATAFTSIGAGRAQIAGRQEERLLLAMVRARVGGMNRWAMDMAGGAGVLFHHHESGGCEPAQNRCQDTDDRFLDERAPAFAIGLDVPVRIASHLEIAAEVRAYFLRRGQHTSESDINLSWQYEWRSSTRAVAALVGRAVW